MRKKRGKLKVNPPLKKRRFFQVTLLQTNHKIIQISLFARFGNSGRKPEDYLVSIHEDGTEMSREIFLRDSTAACYFHDKVDDYLRLHMSKD